MCTFVRGDSCSHPTTQLAFHPKLFLKATELAVAAVLLDIISTSSVSERILPSRVTATLLGDPQKTV